MGICKDMEDYTNITDCESREDSLNMLDFMEVQVNIWTQFFNPKYYTVNNGQN